MVRPKPFLLNQDKSILPFDKKISLNNIYYITDASSPTLKDINLSISAKSIVGCGSIRRGKTTMIDVILGLEPQKHFRNRWKSYHTT